MMTKDEEIEMLNRRIEITNRISRNLRESCELWRRKARKLRKEIKSLRGELDRAKEIIAIHENGHKILGSENENLQKDRGALTEAINLLKLEEKRISRLIAITLDYDPTQSLCANVAAALARAALGKK